ncbi:MAG TPA: hypothetical protein VKG43_07485, partial [Acidimicrobiales bacterium]|nr:hypothetical protein [Acidimicrobiales bacterium]
MKTGHGARARHLAILSAAICAGAATTLLAAAPVLGAGTGYAPAPGGAAGGGTGAPAGTVVTTTTVEPTGGTANGTIGGDAITITVPAGAFTTTSQAVITNAAGATATTVGGNTVVLSFGIGFYQNGVKVSGTFPAVTVTVSGANVNAGTILYLNGSTTPYPTTF